MGVGERGGDPAAEGADVGDRQRPARRDPVGQRLARVERHRQRDPAAVELVQIVRDERGVGPEHGGGADLAQQPAPGGGVGREVRVDDLQRDALLAQAIGREDHGGGAPAADHPVDLEPAGEDGAGGERGRRRVDGHRPSLSRADRCGASRRRGARPR
ncbi:MAG: hypothetical protein ABMB14_16485 [Myxococcota bacterium]